ncbi:MAG: tRNA (N(6)-L-threonylcarbamoyladenosine(37)-C(2))-methylthiotransferase MtaB [Candidatus Omnitrophica bacterium]|nr:tRNA (N(6)-L-threonylcarbamoyladenosine(37)-C(2))-methylthiotransferase MtaB [Candidatus Omnitrophota bacterium]
MSQKEKKTPRFLIQTLGCKVNQYDSERIRSRLLRRGYQSLLSQDDASPDLIIVNTCSVTAESDRKGRQMIRKLIRRHPHARVMVTGCYSERKPKEIERIEGVSEIVAIQDQENWVDRISEEMGWGCEDQDALWAPEQGIELFEEHTRAFVKIQDGCDLRCAFCSIPQSRGRARSRPLDEIRDECLQLVRCGYPEIVLCGICIGHYGRGLSLGLPDLVRTVAQIEGVKRVRISSLEPQHADDALFDVMEERGDVICPHLHLPLQSGSNKILRRMRRPYTMDYFLERVQTARERLPDYELSTDIMTGFPGETDEDFECSLEAVRQCQFNKVHSFRYSMRENTSALRMQDHLPPQIIDERRRELDRLADETADRVKSKYIGRILEILAETSDHANAAGFTKNYLRTDFRSAAPVPPGTLLPVHIEGLRNGRLTGRALE